MDDNGRHEDDAPLARVSKGNIPAFDKLFKTYYKPLVLFANTILKDPDVAEDIVQAFFCKIWEERATLDRVTSASAYFYRAVKNYCHNHRRHQQIIAALPPPEEQHDAGILRLLIEEEAYTLLLRQVDALPPACRQVILLKLQGMDTTAISHACHVSEDTVRSHYRHGKTLLRARLLPILKDPPGN
jgi:RNA polymerase sigma-70 factor (ECF subfamily)